MLRKKSSCIFFTLLDNFKSGSKVWLLTYPDHFVVALTSGGAPDGCEKQQRFFWGLLCGKIELKFG